MMKLKKTTTRHKISRTLHWTVFLTLAMSVWQAYPQGLFSREELDVSQTVPHIDWSWIATGVVVLRIAWHLFRRSTKKINQVPSWTTAYKVVVVLMRWLPLLITVTGVGAIWSVGRDVLAFGFPVVTGLAERSHDLQKAMEVAHIGLWYLLATLLALHVIMALER